jgi:FAD/FMN-containing dehydrogenase
MQLVTSAATPGREMLLSGWGRYPRARGRVERPEKIATLHDLVRGPGGGTFLARGAGRSYGDAALNPEGATVLMERFDRLLAFDQEEGRLRCEAGVTFGDLIHTLVPRGWFPPVTPGTQFVTVGGALAGDIHGKNHHRDGGFSGYVHQFELLCASGETLTCSRDHNADLFWATIGGLGLTGIVTDLDFSLRRVETSFMRCRSLRVGNLDEAVDRLDEYDAQYQYSVAWVDCLSSGPHLGRGVVTLANHATIADLSPALRAAPLQARRKGRLRVPVDVPSGLVTRWMVRGYNEVRLTLERRDTESLVAYDEFFYPLDAILDWNRLYGRSGFVQYQCVVPAAAGRDTLRRLLNRCLASGWGSFLGVLKRLGPQKGVLAFPMPGYTLSLDLPVRAGLLGFLNELDSLVIGSGGRVNLTKDARLSPEAFRSMYPNYAKWRAVKAAIDPADRFASALARRLRMGAP